MTSTKPLRILKTMIRKFALMKIGHVSSQLPANNQIPYFKIKPLCFKHKIYLVKANRTKIKSSQVNEAGVVCRVDYTFHFAGHCKTLFGIIVLYQCCFPLSHIMPFQILWENYFSLHIVF